MGKHARLSPSNMRWPKCPGSVREEAAYPNTSSPAAVDGTGTHLLLEMCLDNCVRAEVYDMQTIGQGHSDNPMGWHVDSERVARVQMCLDYIEQRVTALGKTYKIVAVLAESISNPGEAYGRDDWRGTADITIEASNEPGGDNILYVEVIDYKDGRGYVGEKFNTQLMSYGYGKTHTLATNININLTIVQPKITKNPIRSQMMDLHVLQGYLDKMNQAATLTDDPAAPLIAGKHCQWCKHKPNCDAKSEVAKEVINTMESTGLIEQVHGHLQTMTGEQLTQILQSEKAFKEAFDLARKEAVRRIETGHTVPCYKLAPGRATRAWNETDEVIIKKLKAMKLVQADIFPAKLITPAACEKIDKLSKTQLTNLQKLISTVAGKDSLKEVADAIATPDAQQMFGDVSPELPAPETPEPISFL